MKLQTPDDVANLLVGVLSDVTGFLPERIVRDGGPRPADGPYLHVKWLSFTPDQQNCGEYIYAPEDTDETKPITQLLANTGVAVMRVVFRGEGAFGAAVKAWGWLQMDARTFDLWHADNGIGYGGLVAAIEDASSLSMPGQSGTGKARAHEVPGAYFDFFLNVSFGAAYPVAWFDASLWRLGVHSGESGTPREETHTYPEEIP